MSRGDSFHGGASLSGLWKNNAPAVTGAISTSVTAGQAATGAAGSARRSAFRMDSGAAWSQP